MILVCGIVADVMVELMCARLDDLGYEYIHLDQLRFPGECHLTFEITSSGLSGSITVPNRQVELGDLTGVYARYVNFKGGPQRPELSRQEQTLVDAEFQLAVMHLLDLLPCVVANRAQCSTSNDSKIYQAFLAERFGFKVPRTLVSTEPDDIRDFYVECRRQVVYKSLSSVRSIVQRLEETDLADHVERVRNCPTQFQEYVAGVDIRVHTVGERLFATEIVSDASDYRYAGRQGASLALREITLPSKVEEACFTMAQTLGLAIAGIDLRCTPTGEYYCFEINPSPGFIFYERATGQPISEALAHLLHAGSTSP